VYPTTFGGKNNIGSDESGEGFHDGLALVTVNYKSGFIDKAGKAVVPLQFDYALPFSEGTAAVAVAAGGATKWGYIDKTGKWLIPPQFEWASPFSEGLAAVAGRHDCGYIDSSGKVVLRLSVHPEAAECVSAPTSFAEGLAVWRFGKRFGYVDRTGKIVIKAQFEWGDQFSEGLAAVKMGGKAGFIDKTGKMVIGNLRVEHAEQFRHGLAFISTPDGRYGYIDKTGRFVWKPSFLYTN
jgi:hypothetical protein